MLSVHPSPLQAKVAGLLLVELKVESTAANLSGSLGKVPKIETCIISKLFFLVFLKNRF